MCLGPEFFDAREALILTREAAGDLELEHFLEEGGLTVDRLYELGLLRNDRTTCTTADFFIHTITPEGRRFLKKAEHQLIFVKRSHRESFDPFLKAGGALPSEVGWKSCDEGEGARAS